MNGKPLKKEKDKPKKERKKSVSKLKKELDAIFSQFIRRKYANQEGNVNCYTCPKVYQWKELQCGHFVSRKHLATRFDEENVRPQCVGCNVFGGGQVAVFANKLESERKGIVSALYRKSGEITKNFPYQEKIIHYKALLQQLNERLQQ